MRIQGRLSGVEMTQTMWQAVALREERAVWWGFFRTEEEALEALRRQK
jgi:hypothetical protein